MPIDFQDEKNRSTYAARSADSTWSGEIAKLVSLQGKHVLDIGCGGGIYSRAMAELGAAHVTGIDFSEKILSSAIELSRAYPNVRFQAGNAYHTAWTGSPMDVVLERALIHHLEELPGAFQEAGRLLRSGGTFLVQDRTPEDCLLEGSSTHLRGYFVDKFPRLAPTETARRHSSAKVKAALESAGFAQIEEHTLWETRKVYPTLDALAGDLLKRTGRSILHELTDAELMELVQYITGELLNEPVPLVEKDRWTIWKAVKE